MSYKNFEKALRLIEENKQFLRKVYPQTEDTILLAEDKLGVKFPFSYREFLKKFGELDFRSIEIYGIWKETFDGGYADIVESTLENRSEYKTFHKYIIIENIDSFCYVLDTSQMNEDGECPVKAGYGLFLPDDKMVIKRVYEDFGDFLLDRIQQELEYQEEEEWLSKNKTW